MVALFVCNQLKTVFYEAVARDMRARGVRVFWIALSRRWSDFLLAKGWPREDILNLADYGDEWSRADAPAAEDLARLDRIDSTAQIGIRHALMVDRELNKRPGRTSLAYAAVVVREIEKFIIAKDPTMGFGEITWAPELFTAEIMHHHAKPYVGHATVRVPSERFSFFPGVLQDHFLAFHMPPSDADRMVAAQTIHDLKVKATQPYYMALNQSPHRIRRHWFDEARIALSSSANRHDHTVPSLIKRAGRRLKARWRTTLMGKRPFEVPTLPASRPYVLVTLHKQPEGSVDVLGYTAQNQLENIIALSRLLPVGWQIWVKEHSVATGDRSRDWYAAVKAIPGARLIEPHVPARPLIMAASLVASVSGTSSFEAALLGVPAITFAPLYFAPVLLRSHCIPAKMMRPEMDALLAEAERLRFSAELATRAHDFMAKLIANSQVGIISDPISSEAAISPENICAVAAASVAVLAKISQTTATPPGSPLGSRAGLGTRAGLGNSAD